MPLLNASAIASGIEASASTTFARMRLRLGLLLLFGGLRRILPLGGFGLRDAAVGFGLRGLQLGADVLADVDVGDVDRHDLERRSGIEPFGEHRL